MPRLRVWIGLALVALAVVLAVVPLLSSPPAFDTEELRWNAGDARLSGTLYLPRGGGPHPAALFVPGAGAWTRDEALFRVHAERLAGRGLATLIYDKRGCGRSTGDWRAARLADLAGDARAGLELLRRDARLDPERVGYLATSQGGAVALLAGESEPRPAFLVTLSLSPFSPARQEEVYVEARLRAVGASDAAVSRAVLAARAVQEVYRTGEGWDEARARLDELRAEPWFEASGLALLPRDSQEWRHHRDLPMDFEPLPRIASVAVPHFAAQGAHDLELPGTEAAAILERLAEERGLDLTVVLVPEAEHTLRAKSRGGWTWPAAYWQALEGWLEARGLLK